MCATPGCCSGMPSYLLRSLFRIQKAVRLYKKAKRLHLLHLLFFICNSIAFYTYFRVKIIFLPPSSVVCDVFIIKTLKKILFKKSSV